MFENFELKYSVSEIEIISAEIIVIGGLNSLFNVNMSHIKLIHRQQFPTGKKCYGN